MDGSDPYDSDAEGSDASDSFGQRQLTSAEAEGDPVPAVVGLAVSGVARPGCVLTVDGCPMGGTVRCDFAWLRCSESGSSCYIGENKSRYLVTADDVGSYLAVEAIPVGEDERMGEMIRTFANEHRKISCDLEMHEQIERVFFVGDASFDVSILVDHYNSWQKVKLAIKRDGFYIIQSLRITIRKKFSPSMAVTIPCEHPAGLSIHQGNEYILLLSAETSWLRDVIVLTMRLFITRAVEKDNPSSARASRRHKRRKWFLFF